MNKKFSLFIASTLMVPLMASCGSKPVEYNVSCEASGITISNPKAIKGQEYKGTITINPDLAEFVLLPTNLTKVTSGNSEILPTEYTYTLKEDKVNADFKIPAENIVGDIQIKLSFVNAKKWYEYEDWWNYCSCTHSKCKATVEDIGQEVIVKVNDVTHKVRLIDVDHDNLADENGTAHCTFEFKNVITDASGNVLTTKWDNENSYNFPSSVLNKFLNGDNGDISGSVLAMIPQSLQSKIKTVAKAISTSPNKDGDYSLTTYSTKLFPLSYREISASNESQFAQEEGKTYVFYTGDSGDTNDNRIKSIVGGTSESDRKSYWARSPFVFKTLNNYGFYINYDGNVYNGSVTGDACGIAPAFCI